MHAARAISLIVLIGFTLFVTLPAGEARSPAATPGGLEQQLRQLGTGSGSWVEVQLRDHTKLNGYLSEIRNDSFVVTTPGVHTNVLVDFTHVHKVKGYYMSTGKKVALVCGIAGAATALYVWYWLEHN